MLECVIRNNNYSSMDRILLEGWLIANGVEYRLGRYGNLLCWLTMAQMEELQEDGWTVKIL